MSAALHPDEEPPKLKKQTYLTKLRDDHLLFEVMVKAVRAEVNDLKRYLESNKFNCGDPLDGYVNVKDVLDRLRNVETEITRYTDMLHIQEAG